MQDRQLAVSGVVTFWSISEWTNRVKLRDGLEAAGFAKFVPEQRTPQACLRDALEATFAGSEFMVRPLKLKDGFLVVHEQRGQDSNDYRVELTAKIDPISAEITFSPLDGRAARIVELYNEHLGLLRAAQTSFAAVSILDSLGGTRLRPTGAIYWLPEEKLDGWLKAAEAIEASGHNRQHAVYVVRHRMDQDAVRAVRDAVAHEISSEVERLEREINKGDLGERALEARVEQAKGLRDKIADYEGLLGVGLQTLRESVDRTEIAACQAAVLASASQGETANV